MNKAAGEGGGKIEGQRECGVKRKHKMISRDSRKLNHQNKK